MKTTTFYTFLTLSYPILKQKKISCLTRSLDENLKFSSSSILFSSNTKPSAIEQVIKESIVKNKESELQVIKWESNSGVDPIFNNESTVTSNSESLPWLLDNEGKNIDYNADIKLFDCVQLVSQFLEKRYNLEASEELDVKLTEILQPIYEKERVTVLELYNHVSDLFNKGEFKATMLQVITPTNEMGNETLSDISEISKPLGNFGDITVNEAVTKLQNLQWEVIFDSAKITLHAAPTILNAVGYGLILKSYMNRVHNRPFPENLSPIQLKLHHKIRNRNIAIFSFLGAPLILICLRKTAIGFKDLTSIEIVPNNSNNYLETNNLNKSGIFLILTNLNKNIPGRVKWIFNIIIIYIIILLNLIGFNFTMLIDVLNNVFYLKLYAYLTCSLPIFYQLLNIVLLHIFINKIINISSVLPDFIINWLKDLVTISSNIESTQYFKNSCYIQILLYLLIIFLISFML